MSYFIKYPDLLKLDIIFCVWGGGLDTMITTTFILPAFPPFRLDFTVWALRRRSKNIIDSWDGTYYTRVFLIGGEPVKVQVEQKSNEPRVTISASSLRPVPEIQQKISLLLNKMLGLRINLEAFYALAKKEEILYPLVLQFQGVKPPCFPDIFESFANAVAGQQVSLEAAIALLNRLSRRYGLPFPERDQISYAFPDARTIMKVHAEELREIGFSKPKGETLVHIASKIAGSEKNYWNLENNSNEQMVKLLSHLKGIGRWSSEYVLLRGVRRIDVLPGDDVGFQKSLRQFLALDERPTYAQIQILTKKWHPYAGLVYFHLLLQKLTEKGVLRQPNKETSEIERKR